MGQILSHHQLSVEAEFANFIQWSFDAAAATVCEFKRRNYGSALHVDEVKYLTNLSAEDSQKLVERFASLGVPDSNLESLNAFILLPVIVLLSGSEEDRNDAESRFSLLFDLFDLEENGKLTADDLRSLLQCTLEGLRLSILSASSRNHSSLVDDDIDWLISDCFRVAGKPEHRKLREKNFVNWAVERLHSDEKSKPDFCRAMFNFRANVPAHSGKLGAIPSPTMSSINVSIGMKDDGIMEKGIDTTLQSNIQNRNSEDVGGSASSCNVAQKLVECRLGSYVELIVKKEGFEEFSDLPDTLEGVEALALAAGVKPGHRNRWGKFKASVLSQVPTTPLSSSQLSPKIETKLIASPSPTKEQILLHAAALPSSLHESVMHHDEVGIAPLLKEFRLEAYTHTLVALGFEDASDFPFTSPEAVENVAELMSLKPGHRKRWAEFVTAAAAITT